MFEKLRDFDEAIATYKKAIRRDKNNFQSYYRIGCVYIKNNMRKEGIEALLQAYRIDSETVDTLVKLGEIYCKDDSKIDQAEMLT